MSAKVIALGVLAAAATSLYKHPPVANVERREVGVRLNRLTGATTQLNEGVVLVLPGVHDLRRYSLQDQLYRPERSSKANGEAPFQSSEGLSLGVELTIRYALDPDKLAVIANKLPVDLGGELVETLVQGVISTRCSTSLQCARSSRPSARNCRTIVAGAEAAAR